MSIKKDIEKFGIYFDKKLKNKLQEFNNIPSSLYEATDYILFSGGKRIRPYLMTESYKVFNDDLEKIINFSIAMEMIHTYSLVHDDLPAMDNDDYRRGKLTVHKAFSEDIAILVGDTLLNLAYEVIAEEILNYEELESIMRANRAFSELSLQAGAKGMIGGQVLDMEIEKDNMEIDILRMYELKTGGLFKASTSIGAILAGGSEQNIKDMRDYGKNLGLAYQIQDDILDYEEDIEINKVTVATRYGVDKAGKLCREYTDKAIEILSRIDQGNKSKLKDLTDLLVDRSY